MVVVGGFIPDIPGAGGVGRAIGRDRGFIFDVGVGVDTVGVESTGGGGFAEMISATMDVEDPLGVVGTGISAGSIGEGPRGDGPRGRFERGVDGRTLILG